MDYDQSNFILITFLDVSVLDIFKSQLGSQATN